MRVDKKGGDDDGDDDDEQQKVKTCQTPSSLSCTGYKCVKTRTLWDGPLNSWKEVLHWHCLLYSSCIRQHKNSIINKSISFYLLCGSIATCFDPAGSSSSGNLYMNMSMLWGCLPI
jgi:hypothetical protein